MGVRDVLRIRDYRSIFGGQVVSDIGDGVTFLLLLLVINDLTGSTTALALMAICEALPQFTVGLVAGVYVDRWNRRTVMLAADLLRAVVVIGFAVAAVEGWVPLLYVLAFVQSSISTFFRPARGAMLPRIVPVEGLPAANSLAQGSMVIGGVTGTGIAGLLYGTWGVAYLGFAIDAATFLVSMAFVSRIPSILGRIQRASHDAPQANVVRSMLEGLAIFRHSRVLSGVLLAAAVSMLGLGAVNVLFVPLIVDDLNVSPTWMAGVELAQTSAMILAAGVVPMLLRRFAPTTIVTGALIGVGLCIGAMSTVGAVWQVIIVLFVVGWMVTPFQATVQTIVQTTATDATRGRVVSLLQASMSTASVVSMAIGGVLADLVGIRAVYAGAALVVLGAAGVAMLMFRGVPRRPLVGAPVPVEAEAAAP
jgi:MFS family permease